MARKPTASPQAASYSDANPLIERLASVASVRLVIQRDRAIETLDQVTSPAAAFRIASDLIGDAAEENLIAILMDAKNRVIACHLVARGDTSGINVDVAGCFRAAIVANAVAIIVAHNHPSGDPTPSPQDIAITHRIIAAGQLLGIEVLDHVIVSEQASASLATSYLGLAFGRR